MSTVYKVTATVQLYITVEDGADNDVLEFCANNISYRDAFLGVSDDDMRVTDVTVFNETADILQVAA
jgi:hypothetical protein